MASSLSQKTAAGGAQLLLRRIATYSFRLVAIAILARRLSPAEFGTAAMANVVLQFIVMFGSAGIGTYVICDRNTGWEQRACSAFWLNVALTTGQVLVALALAPATSAYLDQPELLGLLWALAGMFFLEQLRVVPDALLERRLAFRALATRDTLVEAISSAASIAMSFYGFGVWSLVLPRIMLTPLVVVSSFGLAHWRPQFSTGTRHWRHILRFSISLMFTNLLHMVGNDADTIVVGKTLGSAALGCYNVAYQLANLIGRNVTTVIVQVATPALARVNETPGALGVAYMRLLRMLALLVVPALIGMFVIANDLISLLYGPGWASAVSLLRVFIIFTLFRALTSPAGMIFNIVSRTDLHLKLQIGFLAILLPALLAGIQHGAIGVALIVATARVGSGLLALLLSAKLLRLRYSGMVLAAAPAVLAGLVMGGLVWLLSTVLQVAGIGLIPRVALAVALGAGSYGLILHLTRRALVSELVDMASKIVGRRSSRVPAART